MTACRSITLLAFIALCACGGHAQEKKEIAMTHVKYDGLKQEILKQRGKVVLVDFWASNCIPCRKQFPEFIKWHDKYSGQGLVVISVSIDPLEKPKAVAAANKFLNEQRSPFLNLLLDEPGEVLAKRFAYESVPFYYVFDRKGKWVRFRAADYDPEKGIPYDELEKVVVQMLSEK